MPDITLVIAAQDGGTPLQECLAALQGQAVDTLVVDGSPDAAVSRIASAFTGVRVVRASPHANVPQLWSAGIAQATGGIVALTIENCTPAADWARRTREAHAAPWPAIGGAVEMATSQGVAGWAIYFCRYSAYMLPFSSRFPEDFAADNCSYKKAALDAVSGLMEHGFWETPIHAEMRRRGQRLFLTPEPVVFYAGGLTTARFFTRRFVHGRYFAARRSEHFTNSARVLRALGSCVVPLLLLRRMGGRVWKNGRHRGQFLAAFPLILCFLIAWAAGECSGYLRGNAAKLVPGRD